MGDIKSFTNKELVTFLKQNGMSEISSAIEEKELTGQKFMEISEVELRFLIKDNRLRKTVWECIEKIKADPKNFIRKTKSVIAQKFQVNTASNIQKIASKTNLENVLAQGTFRQQVKPQTPLPPSSPAQYLDMTVNVNDQSDYPVRHNTIENRTNHFSNPSGKQKIPVPDSPPLHTEDLNDNNGTNSKIKKKLPLPLPTETECEMCYENVNTYQPDPPRSANINNNTKINNSSLQKPTLPNVSKFHDIRRNSQIRIRSPVPPDDKEEDEQYYEEMDKNYVNDINNTLNRKLPNPTRNAQQNLNAINLLNSELKNKFPTPVSSNNQYEEESDNEYLEPNPPKLEYINTNVKTIPMNTNNKNQSLRFREKIPIPVDADEEEQCYEEVNESNTKKVPNRQNNSNKSFDDEDDIRYEPIPPLIKDTYLNSSVRRPQRNVTNRPTNNSKTSLANRPLPPTPIEADFADSGYVKLTKEQEIKVEQPKLNQNIKTDVGYNFKNKNNLPNPKLPADEPDSEYINLNENNSYLNKQQDKTKVEDKVRKPPREKYDEYILPKPPASYFPIPPPELLPGKCVQEDEEEEEQFYDNVVFNLNDEPFYRNTDRKGSKELLHGLEDGAFLFRPSKSFFVTLTIKHRIKYFNLGIKRTAKNKITCDTNGANIAPEFDSLTDFVRYFQYNPLTIKHSEEFSIYLKPVLPDNRY